MSYNGTKCDVAYSICPNKENFCSEPLQIRWTLLTSKPEKLVTPRFNFKDVIKAFDTFANASKEQALKVINLVPMPKTSKRTAPTWKNCNQIFSEIFQKMIVINDRDHLDAR